MIYKDIAQRIIHLKDIDLALRNQIIRSGKLNDGYNKEMEQLHNSNAAELNEIIDVIGYPTMDKVGVEASEAAWLIIQHAIGQPAFMKQCVNLLEHAVGEDKANPKNLAYLTDRIASFEGRSQLYGTQFDWDENGTLSPTRYDDLTKVNDRRKSIGLNTLEEQVEIMRMRAVQEQQSPPDDLEQRAAAYDAWRRRVGWIK